MDSSKKRIGALVIDGSMDISLGIIAVAIMSCLWARDLLWWGILVGISGAFAPDIDGLYFHFLAAIGRRKRGDLYTHRSGIHYPLLYLPSAALTVWLFMRGVYPSDAWFVALTFVSASFLHFVHDTFLHGWGIPWLYPFRKWRIACFCHTKMGKVVPNVFVFPIENLTPIREKYRDPEWYELFYRFPPHPWMYVIIATHLVGLTIILDMSCGR